MTIYCLQICTFFSRAFIFFDKLQFVMGSFTVLIGGRPAARVTSQVAGVNTVTGVPLTTVVGVGAPTVLIGG